MQEQQHQDALTALCLQHTAALNAAAQRADEQLAKLATSHQDAVTQLEKTQQQEADLASELSSLRQLHEQSLHELRAQHHLELTELIGRLCHAHQTELDNELGELRLQHQAELSHQQQLSEQSAAESQTDLTAQHDWELAELQHEHLVLTQKLDTEHQQSQEQQRQDFAEQLQALRLSQSQSQEHAGRLGQAQEVSEALVGSMQAEHVVHLQELQQQQQKMQEQLELALAQHRAEVDAVVGHCQVQCIDSVLCAQSSPLTSFCFASGCFCYHSAGALLLSSYHLALHALSECFVRLVPLTVQALRLVCNAAKQIQQCHS